ncbi:MAG TPA: SDR family oxidoreductase [Polyangiaceae bacterium]|jgi:nucleoside-diphosphate-sugar epimerase|nr:SDR family oxidoreductase [Polyangiaceae bacterium]
MAPETALVTGFPGFRAERLVRHLLDADRQAKLVLLRPQSDAEPSARALDSFDAEARARVKELAGDPAALDFGLRGAEYVELSRTVQRVYHFASALDASERGATAERNIAYAREVIEFASAMRRPRGVVVLSSVNVAGSRSGTIREDELAEGQSFRNRIEESLATVEAMFARHPNVPQIILRPTTIVGDSATGEIDRLGFPYPWLVFIDRSPEELVVPVPQRPDSIVQIVPIDFVVRAAVLLGTNPAAYGKRFHLVDPAPPTLREFFALAAAASGKRLSTNFNAGALTRGLVSSRALKLLAQGARGVLDLLAPSPRFEASNAEAFLNESTVRCPPVASYITPLLERARAGFAAHEVEPLDPAHENG